jgi:uncharacterized protein
MATERIEACDVWELARKKASVQGELAARQLPRLAEQLAGAADERLRFSLQGGIGANGRPTAVLELDGALSVRCDRCGEAVTVPIRERARFFFVADEAELGRLPIDDAPDEPLLGSRRFDLAALIEDQAILALPISPRHEGCAAAAVSVAGQAPEGLTQRPFAGLAGLKKRRN